MIVCPIRFVIFNLMRNIGGSVGIAIATTMLARDSQRNISRLGAHVNVYSPQSQVMVENLRRAMMARGSDAYTATREAYGTLFGMVQQQASILSFLQTFRLLGFIFIAVLPLLLLFKRPKHRGGGPPVH